MMLSLESFILLISSSFFTSFSSRVARSFCNMAISFSMFCIRSKMFRSLASLLLDISFIASLAAVAFFFKLVISPFFMSSSLDANSHFSCQVCSSMERVSNSSCLSSSACPCSANNTSCSSKTFFRLAITSLSFPASTENKSMISQHVWELLYVEHMMSLSFFFSLCIKTCPQDH